MKIYIIGNYSTIFLKKELKKKMNNINFEYQILNSDYNSIEYNILDKNSNLYKYEPDVLIWHESTLRVRELFYSIKEKEKSNFADDYENRLVNYLSIVKDRLPKCKILFPNHSLLFNDNLYGSYSLQVEFSWQYQIIKLNYLLNNLSIKFSNLFLLDSSAPINDEFFVTTDYSLYNNADLPFTLDYLNFISSRFTDIILSFIGKSKKCIILDLDNTLWGGVIGDDGIYGIEIGNYGIGKSYKNLQYWLKELSRRGIILAVCSKNNDDIAKEPFISHPEMILGLEDIVLFIANWNNKADNIRLIQKQLNISFDSMVFIDDNPAERDIVSRYIPEIIVPDLPIDPCNYLPFLINLNLFETINFTKNDGLRTKQYLDEIKRTEHFANLTNMDDYLNTLNMKIRIQSFDFNNIERISQLTLRSNQFNLTTKRYTISDIELMIDNPNYITYSVNLSDKFGDYGLISVVILEFNKKNVTIDTWLMSCRVLNRNVEYFLMNHIVSDLISKGFEELIGHFLPTEKNSLVSNLLSDLSMTLVNPINQEYKLILKNYNEFKTPIIYE